MWFSRIKSYGIHFGGVCFTRRKTNERTSCSTSLRYLDAIAQPDRLPATLQRASSALTATGPVSERKARTLKASADPQGVPTKCAPGSEPIAANGPLSSSATNAKTDHKGGPCFPAYVRLRSRALYKVTVRSMQKRAKCSVCAWKILASSILFTKVAEIPTVYSQRMY